MPRSGPPPPARGAFVANAGALCLALGLALCAALGGSGGSAGAQEPDAGGASVGDAGAPRVASAQQELAAAFEAAARQVEQLTTGELPASVAPASLFDVELGSAPLVALERERLGALLAASSAEALRAAESDARAGETDAQTALRLAPLRLAQRRLDQARLAFLSLPETERRAKLEQHAQRSARALTQDGQGALSAARKLAAWAAAEQQAALAAARHSGSEAQRLVHEERARLLEIERRQAEFEKSLIEQRAELEQRREALLGWRRRVGEALEQGVERSLVDELYTELSLTLERACQSLAEALGEGGHPARQVPRAGPSQLLDLPTDVDLSAVSRVRAEVVQKSIELATAARHLARDRRRDRGHGVEVLSSLRLQMLPRLSPSQRNDVLGFGAPGLRQAATEVRQVVLTARSHIRISFDWLQQAAQSSEQRGQAMWVMASMALRGAWPLAVFVWWRRRAEALLRELRMRARGNYRRRRRALYRVNYADRGLAFLQKVRKPLELLVFARLQLWLLPEGVKGLLETQLLGNVLSWVLGAQLAVTALDASFFEDAARRYVGAARHTPRLRLRSLRLVARATLVFGLLLSCSDLLVGQGTIYAWVASTCWLSALPLVMVLVSWWRPVIFKRLGDLKKPNSFERWVLKQSSPAGRVAAAVAGGVYLFARGSYRVGRAWVLDFTLTRRLLAYLFRRDLNKKAQSQAAVHYGDLEAATFQSLGPETPSGQEVEPEGKCHAAQLAGRIADKHGLLVAIVGERGSGKSDLLRQLSEGCDKLVHVACPAGGLRELRKGLAEALEIPSEESLDSAIAKLDREEPNAALFVDNAHHLIRPMMGGLAEFDRLLRLCRRHSRRCAWILAFDKVVWQFLERARETRPLFDDIVLLKPWKEERIVRLLTHRNAVAGVQAHFDHLISDLPLDADSSDRAEAVLRTEANYYRLLWDYAAGNPGVALHFWRRSLGVDARGRVRVRVFNAPDAEALDGLPDSTVFVLRALVQLDWASAEDVRHTTQLPLDQVSDALRFGMRNGYFDRNGVRYRVTWDWFRAVTRFLQRRHLIPKDALL